MANDRPDHAAMLKYALTDVRRVTDALGLTVKTSTWSRQSNGVMVLCPVHSERTPSCSVQLREGIIQWKCHGCDACGDTLTLIAVARGLDCKLEFRAVLVEAARIARMWSLVEELEQRRGPGPARPVERQPEAPPPADPEAPREYPPQAEVAALWAACVPTMDDDAVARCLASRALDPAVVDALEIARALPPRGALPSWAVCKGGDWRRAGYRLIVPVYDAAGAMRSVRAWRVVGGDGPKRRPPFERKASELVMADAFGVAMLRGEREPKVVAICEGEPNFLSRAITTREPDVAVLGIVSGSWTEAFAARVPVGAKVALRTDNDEPGDRYAAHIASTLRRRAFLYRVSA